MMEDKGILTRIVREFLIEAPGFRNRVLEIFDIPAKIFESVVINSNLIIINRLIKDLPLRNQKLLFFYCKKLEPSLIIESLGFESPDLFWNELAETASILNKASSNQDSPLLGEELAAEINDVFRANELILSEINRISDEMDVEEEKARKRRKKYGSLISIPILLIPAYLFIYPLIMKPDLNALFEDYKNTYNPDLSLVDTLDPDGGRYHEAVLLFQEEDYGGAMVLFKEIVDSETIYVIESQWFMTLINLNQGNAGGSRELLKMLRRSDPDFFRFDGQKVLRKLK